MIIDTDACFLKNANIKRIVKFKVRDMITGLYQDAKIEELAGTPSWSKRGKTWADIAQLKRHFAVLELFRISMSPLWEVIEYRYHLTNGTKLPDINHVY